MAPWLRALEFDTKWYGSNFVYIPHNVEIKTQKMTMIKNIIFRWFSKTVLN